MNPTHPTALSPAPHGTPTLLDVRRLVTFGPDAADRFSGTNEGMSSSSTTRGTVMMVIGLLMILATVLIAVLTEDPLPAAFGAIGVVFIAVGARQRGHGVDRATTPDSVTHKCRYVCGEDRRVGLAPRG